MSKKFHRTVRKIEPHDEQTSNGSTEAFSHYLGIPNIILLGDPGSGKTHTFKKAAENEKAKFLPVRHFLATEGRDCAGLTIYLDGLDEFRSRIDDKNAVNEVIKSLSRLGRPRLRLSCRVFDWLGETDLSLFQSYFDDSPYVVLLLEPLNRDEIAAILREKGIVNTEKFVREAEGHGLEGLLGNPQTLIMLSDVVGHGTWPKTKLELFETSIQLLLAEPNRERVRSGLGEYTPTELTTPVGAACASILISGVAGISLLENNRQADFPSYRSVPYDDIK